MTLAIFVMKRFLDFATPIKSMLIATTRFLSNVVGTFAEN